jgi:hypothetical protein
MSKMQRNARRNLFPLMYIENAICDYWFNVQKQEAAKTIQLC